MMYVNGIGGISAVSGETNVQGFIPAEEPEYTRHIPAGQLRRMSRIMKMGLWAGREALADAGIGCPDAIITATAFGCNEDTEKFLRSYIQSPGSGSPTPFIQSTHNVVGGQLALALGCNGYNMTYAQRGFSFESALTDAELCLAEGAATVLCGAFDEVTPLAVRLFRQMGDAVPGEAASFFTLASSPGIKCYGAVTNISCQLSDPPAFIGKVKHVFEEQLVLPADAAIMASGQNGDAFEKMLNNAFQDFTILKTAPLYGTFATDSALATLLALRHLHSEAGKSLNKIAVIRSFNGSYFRLLIIEKIHR